MRGRLRRPTKVFEENPQTEFDFFLAQKLGRTVDEMRRTLSHSEYLYWTTYYARVAQRQELEQLKAEAKTRG